MGIGRRGEGERERGMRRNRLELGCTLYTPGGGGGRKLRIRSLLARTKVKIHLRSEVVSVRSIYDPWGIILLHNINMQ